MSSCSRLALLVVSLASSSLSQLALASERPLVGDPLNGERLYKETTGEKGAKVDGAWLNRYGDAAALKALEQGKAGFPRISGDNVLNRWDVLAYLRGSNVDVRDLVGEANYLLLSSGSLDEHAENRLKERASLKLGSTPKEGPVYVFYKLDKGDGLARVQESDNKTRDMLKPDKKLGYVVFLPLEGLRAGGYEAAIALNPDIEITGVEVRAPDGSLPDDLNQAARRFVGRGGRAKYQALKAAGAGKAMSELEKPLSNAFLVGAERVYMYEVKERDYFAFDE